MSQAEEFADFRRHKAERKAGRLTRFESSAPFIRADAKSIGWALNWTKDGRWTFRRVATETLVRWWPASGKTDTGARFLTWPELKQYLSQLSQGA